ncbi:hypothetical protein TSUD_238560 [Trifolium subterraneum]|uniref:Transmembrane protein n=1 Tax=Trifolium subterraneum TaxID=3900 RepID=A0A2Z6PP26_TRISU|nr:hypothetical protein TSUD_238560 [Trifolium subterraneum]
MHCNGREEAGLHLFMFCDFAGAAASKNIWKGYALIWHATIWTIWKSRNNIIFSNSVKDPDKAIDEIKFLFCWPAVVFVCGFAVQVLVCYFYFLVGRRRLGR